MTRHEEGGQLGKTWCAPRVLVTWRERLRGLLGTDATARPVVLVGCSSVHTFGMRYAIDVAFVSAQGTVLAMARAVGPARVVSCAGARYVIERPHVDGPWLEAGMSAAVLVMACSQGRGEEDDGSSL